MDIYIDGQKTDFKLENETNLFEVASEVEKWTRTNGRFLRRFTAAGQTWYGTDESLKSLPLSDLKEVAFETILPRDLAREALGDVLIFFQKLDALPLDRLATVPDLSASLQWCANVIAKSQVILKLDLTAPVPGRDFTIADWLTRIERISGEMKQDPSASARHKEELDPRLSAAVVESLIAAVAPDEAQPSREEISRRLQAGRLELPELIDRIASLTERLHAGRDQEAMNELTGISTSLTVIIRTLQQADVLLPAGFSSLPLPDGSTVAGELGGLTDVFKKIVEAFDSRDIVLLCDLLEYELSPRLTALDKVLELLDKELKTSFN